MTESESLAEREPVRAEVEERPSGGALIRAEFHELHVGPLPDPQTLKAYDDVCAGAAERILAMAERQAGHRQSLERMVIESDCKAQGRGPIFGFILACMVIGAGVWLLATGRDLEGLIALIAPLASIVIPFLYSKKQKSKELKETRFRDVQAPPAGQANSPDNSAKLAE